MPAILLSHHRTGSTAMQAALSTRLRVCPDEPLLSPLEQIGAGVVFDWPAFLQWAARYDVLHCHREHIDQLEGWEAIAESGAKIIHLTRQRRLHQVLSYRRALQDGVWHEHPRGHSHDDSIELETLRDQLTLWATLEAKAEFYFRALPALHVTTEEFEAAPFPTIERIVAFVTPPA